MSRGRYAPVFALPVCRWCRHPLAAHWSHDGCQAATGPRQTCGCREPPPDPDHDDGQDHDEQTEEPP